MDVLCPHVIYFNRIRFRDENTVLLDTPPNDRHTSTLSYLPNKSEKQSITMCWNSQTAKYCLPDKIHKICTLFFFLGFRFISGSVQMRDEEQTNISCHNHKHQIQLLYNWIFYGTPHKGDIKRSKRNHLINVLHRELYECSIKISVQVWIACHTISFERYMTLIKSWISMYVTYAARLF